MKNLYPVLALVCAIVSPLPTPAQTSPTEANDSSLHYEVAERGPHHKTMQRIETRPAPDGQPPPTFTARTAF